MKTLPAIVLLLTCLLAMPAFGQSRFPDRAPPVDPPSAEEEANLREWYQALPAERRRQLHHRAHTIRRMHPERRERLLEAAGDGHEAFSEEDKQRLEELQQMPYLRRARMQILAHELRMVRRVDPRGYRQAMELEGEARVEALRDMLQRQRAFRRMREMSPEERERFEAMDPDERREAFRERQRQAALERRERLNQLHPELQELRSRAEIDAEARARLRELLPELVALDILLQHLDDEAGQRVLGVLAEDGREGAAQAARKELREQWQRERQHPHRERPDRRGFGREQKGQRPPDSRGGTDRPDRRERGNR